MHVRTCVCSTSTTNTHLSHGCICGLGREALGCAEWLDLLLLLLLLGLGAKGWCR